MLGDSLSIAPQPTHIPNLEPVNIKISWVRNSKVSLVYRMLSSTKELLFQCLFLQCCQFPSRIRLRHPLSSLAFRSVSMLHCLLLGTTQVAVLQCNRTTNRRLGGSIHNNNRCYYFSSTSLFRSLSLSIPSNCESSRRNPGHKGEKHSEGDIDR